MPEISAASVLPPSSGSAAPAAVAMTDPASAGQTFVTQLKTALASVTSVVTRPKAKPATPPDEQDAQASTATPTADADAARAAKSTDHADLMPELLAALGFGLVPLAVAAPEIDKAAVVSSDSAKGAPSTAGSTLASDTTLADSAGQVQRATPPVGGTQLSGATASPPSVGGAPTTLVESSMLQQLQDAVGLAMTPAAQAAITAAAQAATALRAQGTSATDVTLATLATAAPVEHLAAAATSASAPAVATLNAGGSSATGATASGTAPLAGTDSGVASTAAAAGTNQAAASAAAAGTNQAAASAAAAGTNQAAASAAAAGTNQPAAAAAGTSQPPSADSTTTAQVDAPSQQAAAAPLAGAAQPAEALQSVQGGLPQMPHNQTGSPAAVPAGVATLDAAQFTGQSMDSGTGGNGAKSGAHKTSASSDSDVVPASADALAAATTTVSPTPVAQPPAVQPSEVVNQIAQQADLYRLPGNRGVRIQLHPDDLGGVQVTVKYAADGGIELHINTEHADTSALVQAGWTQLRDALAIQGISPERLVMSVTSPTSASEMNFASNGGQGGSGTEANTASFGQTSQGQQRQSPDEARRASTGSPNSIPIADTTSRAAPAAASAHIDYRV
jgi:trimeric autotransporter adhesin